MKEPTSRFGIFKTLCSLVCRQTKWKLYLDATCLKIGGFIILIAFASKWPFGPIVIANLKCSYHFRNVDLPLSFKAKWFAN